MTTKLTTVLRRTIRQVKQVFLFAQLFRTFLRRLNLPKLTLVLFLNLLPRQGGCIFADTRHIRDSTHFNSQRTIFKNLWLFCCSRTRKYNARATSATKQNGHSRLMICLSRLFKPVQTLYEWIKV